MKNAHKVVGALLFLAAMLTDFDLGAKPDLKNIIMISVDTLRADHLGCYGYPLNTSPAIDAFARDGILFSRCYALTPLTGPSFATMLTSLPPHKHGAKRNGLPIYRKIKTLPYYLERYGYRSAAFISNWPLRKKLCGLHKDFDLYREVFTKKRWLGIMTPEGGAAAVTSKAAAWLKEHQKKRFFLWVQYTEPHAPYHSHKGFSFDCRRVADSTYPPGSRMGKIEKYDSEIAYTDFYIGKLIAKIKRLHLYDQALIIFNGDHGESFGEHNYFRHGRKLYNSTLHVPLIIKLPGNRFKNSRRDENVCLLDIAPTIFSTLKILDPPHMEGISLVGNDSPILNRKIILQTYAGAVHMKRKNKKYHLKVKPVRYGIIEGRFKLIYNIKERTHETYQLSDDPFEVRNLFSHLSLDAGIKEMKQVLETQVDDISKYIKLSRKYHLEAGGLSKEDLEALKSLGYID